MGSREKWESLLELRVKGKKEQSQYSGTEQGMREEIWLASEGSLTFKATFEPDVSM